MGEEAERHPIEAWDRVVLPLSLCSDEKGANQTRGIHSVTVTTKEHGVEADLLLSTWVLAEGFSPHACVCRPCSTFGLPILQHNGTETRCTRPGSSRAVPSLGL
ncbi:hypothetical protein GGTG_00474 [Gaeumannomyces tritici R3-111a-1]|uniref:Uncharacterized protein n=1 Tax=Gaeumannomyces tritici (strain R3-111a-1) TaxID=644352 RepID=J3NGT5_GAET3|nr:hypothetical protein GGTG_00474 [Gaeumannomyces tritici R3-111a-1]EJT80475.1 hypothetical protein GGTG_00474 [Gaeumannomyces tritici R3-111a-1]